MSTRPTKRADRASKKAIPRAPAPSGISQETLSDFSQVISHRIGSLLSGIEGYTDLILSSLDSKEDRENAFRILESVSRISGILADVKHYQESVSVSLEQNDVRHLLSDVLNLLADSESERLIFECKTEAGLTTRMDQPRVKQALLSVLRNAFEITAPGKLPVSFFVEVDPKSEMIQFRIYNPIPIAEKRIRKQVFNPFFTTKAANLGLGLTMARRIFHGHGGDIHLTSAPMDSGTEFTCFLPIISS